MCSLENNNTTSKCNNSTEIMCMSKSAVWVEAQTFILKDVVEHFYVIACYQTSWKMFFSVLLSDDQSDSGRPGGEKYSGDGVCLTLLRTH